VATLAAIVAVALLPTGALVAFAIAWLALTALSAVAGLGPLRLVRGSWVALPFVGIAVPLAVTRPGEPLAELALGPVSVTVTDAGLRDVVTIVLKAWLSVQVALLLAYTTRFPDLIEALRALRLPTTMVGIVSFMYRYLAVLGDETTRMNRARAARSAVVSGRGGGRLAWRARVTGSMVGSLFLRSYERSERVYAAMQARGFEGTLRGLGLGRLRTADVAGLALLLAVLAAFTLAAHLWSPSW
jgi:cobalt/nickel transport system permease protein